MQAPNGFIILELLANISYKCDLGLVERKHSVSCAMFLTAARGNTHPASLLWGKFLDEHVLQCIRFALQHSILLLGVRCFEVAPSVFATASSSRMGIDGGWEDFGPSLSIWIQHSDSVHVNALNEHHIGGEDQDIM